MRFTYACAAALCVVWGADRVSADVIGVSGGNSIQGQLCVGLSCLASESFGSDVLRLKSANVQLHFEDTSADSGAFPFVDWRININDNFTGGDSYFALTDVTNGTTPLRIFASAPTNSVIVSEDGDVGLGTPTPVTKLHLRSGNTPTLRLEQDVSNSFQAQVWDIAANETAFRVRDVTNASKTPFRIINNAADDGLVVSGGGVGIGLGSPMTNLHLQTIAHEISIRLERIVNGNEEPWDLGVDQDAFFIRDVKAGKSPFRIRPGAPQNAIYVEANGQVGVGLQNPRGALHVRRNQPNNLPHLLLQNRREGGRTEIWFEDRDTATDDDALRLQLRGDDFNITFNGTGGSEFQVSKTGDVRIFRGNLVVSNGGVIVGGSTLNVPDYVFADDYELMPLGDVAAFIDENAHLPHIPSAAEIAETGLDMTAMLMAVLKSHEELTLHTLAQEREIITQRDRIAALEAIIGSLNAEQ